MMPEGLRAGLLTASWVLASYLCGAIPFGLIVARIRGIDIRRHGSGNIGATNVGRVLGRPCGVLVFFLDLLKGSLPTAGWGLILASSRLGSWSWTEGPGGFVLWILIALAAILGHVFPIYLRFKGGKGVATTLGALLGVYPYYTLAGMIAFAVWGLTISLARYVSVASMSAAIAFPIIFALVASIQRDTWGGWRQQWPLQAFSIVVALLVVYRHKSNIRRLREGAEPKIGTSRSAGNEPKSQ